jgi:hypothetical protein
MVAPLTSFLSTVSEFARATLDQELFKKHGSSYRVTLDSPSGVQKIIEADGNSHGALNLFFYRFEPSGFFPQASANDRWHVRARCLMTAFSITETEGTDIIPAGEIDLRVLGSVMQHLHEHPVMVDTPRGIHLEVVAGNLSSEEINQIWASQHNVPYRPSLLYEFALLPVEPSSYNLPPALVTAGGTSVTVHFENDKTIQPTKDIPQSPFMEVSKSDDWAPLISFVDGEGRAVQTISKKINDVTAVNLWIAGSSSSSVKLIWEYESKGEWKTDFALSTSVIIPAQPVGLGNIIDPDVVKPSVLIKPVTITLTVPTVARTYLLYVQRQTPLGPRRSNPLMLHLKQVTP